MKTKLSNAIREARQFRGLSQAQISEMTGIPQNRISDYETARHEPTEETIIKLEEALDVIFNIHFTDEQGIDHFSIRT